MKRIIEGVAYDTDTSIRIASGSHDHELSDPSWALYRTKHGAYFEVVAGHDGVVESCNPLTDKQAREFLEVNANYLVEQHFGPMPEARPLRFSRKTLVSGIKILEGMTHGTFTEFMLELAPDLLQTIGDEPLSLRKRLNNLIMLLDDLPNRQLDGGALLRDVIVAKAASLVPPVKDWLGSPTKLSSSEEAFTQTLALDGFVLSDGAIRSALPVDVDLPGAESDIDRLLHKHGLGTPKGHLQQALNAHARGDWAAANSQIRTFVEALMDELAVKLDSTATTLSGGHPRRERLASLGFFIQDLNEWDSKGLGFFNGLIKRLHPQGSHPGLSDADDSTFRLHLVMIAARLLLIRFDAKMP